MIIKTIPLIVLLLVAKVSISQVIICGKIENVPNGSSVNLEPDWNGIAQGTSCKFDLFGNFFIKLNKTDEKATWTLHVGKKLIRYIQLNDKDSIYITGDLQYNDSSVFELSKNTTFFATGKGSSKINYTIANSTFLFHASDMSILNEEQMLDFAENFKNQCLLFLTTIKTKKAISEKLIYNDNMKDYYNKLFLNGSITRKETDFIINTIKVNELENILYLLKTYDGTKPHSLDTLKISLKNNYFNHILTFDIKNLSVIHSKIFSDVLDEYLNFLIVKSKIEKGKVVLKKDYNSVVLETNVGGLGELYCRNPDYVDTVVNKPSKNIYEFASKTLIGDVKDYFLTDFVISQFCYCGATQFKYFYPKLEKDIKNKFYLTKVNRLYNNLNDKFSTQLFLNKDKWSLTDSTFLELIKGLKNQIILINLYAINIREQLKPFDNWDDYILLNKTYKNKIVCLNICYTTKNYINAWDAIIKQNEWNDNYFFYSKENENKTFATWFKHFFVNYGNTSFYVILDKNGKFFYKNYGSQYLKAYKKIDELL